MRKLPSQNKIRLDKQREYELALRWRDHADPAAGNSLALAAQDCVIASVRRYRSYGLPDADLIAEANFGVVQALHKFDPERGVRFNTFARHWIRASLLEYVVKSWSMVGAGKGILRTNMFFKIRRERALVASYLGTGAAADEAAAARIGMTPGAFADLTRPLDQRDLCFEAPTADGAGTWADCLASSHDQERDLANWQLERSLSAAIQLATRELDARERYIVEQRLMADRDDAPTLVEVGRKFGVSPARARQIEMRAVRKLRRKIAACADPVAREWLGGQTAKAS
jgi:RNA polymerase sigma-32 factor